MKTVSKGLMAAGLMAAFVASPAAAQMKTFGFGINGAYFQSGKLAESASTGNDLDLHNRGALGAGLEWWMGASRRVALRADGSYTKTPFQLEFGTNTEDTNAEATLDGLGKVNTWLANANLMLRLLAPTVDRKFAPFISVGGGLVRWDTNNDQVNDVRLDAADVQIYHNAQSEGAAFGSLGTDIYFTPNVALRLEGKDYWNPSSPYIVASTIGPDQSHHDGGHNFLWTAGLQFAFGGAPVKEPGFIAAAPAPEPAPVVVEAPAPPPAPTTEAVNMCYVDQNGRLQTVSATRNLSNSNIYVTQNGSDVLFSTAYPTTEPYYIKGASWYVASRPVIVDLGNGTVITTADVDVNTVPNRIEFVNFGTTQPLMSSDLMYVGSLNGTPLYARTSDVGAFSSDLDASMRASSDLNRMLADKTFADRYVNEIQTFYMPVEPGSECVFQPLSSTHVVRRTRG